MATCREAQTISQIETDRVRVSGREHPVDRTSARLRALSDHCDTAAVVIVWADDPAQNCAHVLSENLGLSCLSCRHYCFWEHH